MIQFKQYPSIGRASDEAWMAFVRSAVKPETLFAVQEKVDGANVSFLCDDTNLRMARRTAILGAGEPFFRYQELLDRYEGAVYHVFNRLRSRYRKMTSIVVYGELFGGGYPHPCVPLQRQVKPVQKEVWYIPGYDFYAFDIYVFMADGGFFLPVQEANDLFAAAGFHYAHNLFTGPLDECLAFPCDFPTTIPSEYGLPLLEDNLCEGIVIKPLLPIILPDGSRVAFKVRRETVTAT